ncbi:MAG: hypothetical protein GX811_07490, partial [Lentisphaerae bacterium]|nr:hypothetical protein [Lentisphaerota bacterium]
VEPFMEAGIPTFVAKPFCYDPKEGLKFLAKAQKLGTPVTSYSHMTLRKSFVAFVKSLKAGKFGQVNAASTCGPADIKSKYGGVFFYGIHQVDMALTAFGHDVQSVSMQRSGDNAVGQLLYPSGLKVSIFLIKDYAGDFSFSLCTDKGPHSQTFENDEVPHLTGIQRFCKMFKTGKEPLSHEQIIKPIQVLEGFEKSIANAGKVTKIK